MSTTKRIALCGIFVAIGILGSFIYIPIGVVKCFPIQHMINVLSAIILGPMYAVITAFSISFLRNILGVGTIFAYTGSMIGAFLAGIIYKRFKREIYAVGGELVGTGIIGGIVSFYLGKILFGTETGAIMFVLPFFVSSLVGSILGFVIIKILKKKEVLINSNL